jgi:LysM repeat protein
LRKIGWDKWSGNFFSYIFNKKTVHFLVFVLVLTVSVQSSLLKIGMAKALSDNINKTRFSKLITKELYEDSEDDLIEEYFADNVFEEQTRYLDDSNILSSNSGVGSDIDNEYDFLASGEDILVKPDLSTTQLGKKTRKEAVEYVVQSGDTISTIAADFDISVNTILWENSLSSGSVIRPGDKLTILQDSGVSHKIVKGDTLIAIAKK